MRTPMRTIVLACLLVSPPVAFAVGPAGQVDPLATVADICKPGWSAAHRNVTAANERAAYTRQGLAKNSGACARVVLASGSTAPACIVDHVVSLENGGVNALANLQVQTIAESKAKDRIENFLHAEICAGRLALDDAQGLERNWRYLRPPGLATPTAFP